jgi:hypothetical protein
MEPLLEVIDARESSRLLAREVSTEAGCMRNLAKRSARAAFPLVEARWED